MRVAVIEFVLVVTVTSLFVTVNTFGFPSLHQLPTVASISDNFVDESVIDRANTRSLEDDSCSTASSAFLWFLKVLQNCTQRQHQQHAAPSSHNNLCGQLDPSGFFAPENSDQLPWLQPYLLQQDITSTMLSPSIISGLNLLLTAQSGGGGSMGAQAVSLGEVSYILGQVAQGWASVLRNGATTSKFWSVWTQGWMDGAKRIIADRQQLTPAEMLRAANYFFIAMQPFPVSTIGQQAFNASYDWLFRHLNAMQREGRLKFISVSIPYTTDDGVSLTLPAIAVTPILTPNGPQQTLPPLVIATAGGFDFPLPGEVVRSLYAYLDAGFAVLIYEGPGQGRTLYNQTQPLRFTPRWDRVLSAVASFAETQLPSLLPYNTTAGVMAASESFGGFLIPQACSAIDPSASIVKGCIADPATSSFAFALNYVLAGRFIAPFQTVNTTLLDSLCGPYCADYAANYFGVSATYAPSRALFSMDPLLSAMTSSSCVFGRKVWQGLFQIIVSKQPNGIFPTDLLYVILALVPPGPDTYADINHLVQIVDNDRATVAKLLVDGIARIQDYVITKNQVESTRVPIAAFGGTQDFAYESQATKEYFATLPVQAQGLLKIFDEASGAAGHCEVGAWQVVWPYYLRFVQAVALESQ